MNKHLKIVVRAGTSNNLDNTRNRMQNPKNKKVMKTTEISTRNLPGR
jgi:hypothetical protein